MKGLLDLLVDVLLSGRFVANQFLHFLLHRVVYVLVVLLHFAVRPLNSLLESALIALLLNPLQVLVHNVFHVLLKHLHVVLHLLQLQLVLESQLLLLSDEELLFSVFKCIIFLKSLLGELCWPILHILRIIAHLWSELIYAVIHWLL